MPQPTVIVVEHGDLYTPEPHGADSLLLADSKILKIGQVDRSALDRLGVEYEVVDASDGYVVPGFIDPHEHLLGSSGEGGLALQSPMLFLTEIVRAGITTVVGVLGVDTTMMTMEGLLARVKGLYQEGLSTRMWTGGYNVPPTTVMNSVREDIMFLDECVGTGEVAISDERGLNQSAQELAKLIRDTFVGGHLADKAGVTHFHVGEESTRLAPLREVIEDFQVKPAWLYPTHVQRNETLLDEAIALARRGATVDFDTTKGDLAKWFRYYRDHGGPLDRLTISSDADSGTPDIHLNQLCGLVVNQRVPLETVLPLVTTNVARILKYPEKGTLAAGCDADVVVLQKGTLEVREVIARGKRMVVGGELAVRERFLSTSSRKYPLLGDQYGG